MDRVPPRLVRRLIVAPIVFVLAVALLALSPVLLAIAALADVFLPGNLRTTRLLSVGVVYLAYECMGIVVLFALWLASGFGLFLKRTEPAHYLFIRWWLSGLFAAAQKLIGLRIELEGRHDPQPGAVLVFPRHAGPGDSILIAGTLMRGYERHPRVVMKCTLQWAPCVDIVGNRLNGCFIRPADRNASRFIDRIGRLAVNLGEHDAIVLFPEGGNFTPRRRVAAIERLRGKGLDAFADQAERMTHLVAPRPGGALAAISNAPHADVVFVAHTGLEYLNSLGELWRSVPLQRPILGRYWRIQPKDIPEEHDARIAWLYGWWSFLDTWIEEHRAQFIPRE